MSDEQTTREQQLRELVDEWRYKYAQAAGSNGYLREAQAFEKCADDLEEALN